MTNMTETDSTIILAGRIVGFIRPTQGQMESMVRIGKTIQRGTDDDSGDFYITQIHRVGLLLESLIAEKDRELVDELYLTGQIDHAQLMTAIMNKINAEAVKSEDKAIAKAKTVRAQRK
jgi:hypothetical protein